MLARKSLIRKVEIPILNEKSNSSLFIGNSLANWKNIYKREISFLRLFYFILCVFFLYLPPSLISNLFSLSHF